ncbi:hypothetical protein QOT17_009965 [Balamuthia mandrillaris]
MMNVISVDALGISSMKRMEKDYSSIPPPTHNNGYWWHNFVCQQLQQHYKTPQERWSYKSRLNVQRRNASASTTSIRVLRWSTAEEL